MHLMGSGTLSTEGVTMFRIAETITGKHVADVDNSLQVGDIILPDNPSDFLKGWYRGRIEQWAYYDRSPNTLTFNGYTVEEV